jgi:magnesium transporter
MITLFLQKNNQLISLECPPGASHLIQEALWIDLLEASEEEEKLVSETLDIEMPSKKEMEEIEPSSRLYRENDSLFLTATMVAYSEAPEPKSDAVTFILTENKFITIRHIEPQAFVLYFNMIKKATDVPYTPYSLLIGLFETTTDRLADILEKISDYFDELSYRIFHKSDVDNHSLNYKEILLTIGVNRILGSKIRDSLISFNRIISFLEKAKMIEDAELNLRLNIIKKDIAALSDYAVFISSEVNFLLDATLGMVNIEQNAIIKIFSVAAVIFLPPTLLASIYGMNFKHMPELDWFAGYPISLLLMVISAWLPYHYFRKKKWL